MVRRDMQGGVTTRTALARGPGERENWRNPAGGLRLASVRKFPPAPCRAAGRVASDRKDAGDERPCASFIGLSRCFG